VEQGRGKGSLSGGESWCHGFHLLDDELNRLGLPRVFRTAS
jgi:hypothetical protein